MATDLYEFTVSRADGSPWELWDLHGQVVLVVALHTAAERTPQLTGVDQLSQAFGSAGLAVVGVPMAGSPVTGSGYGVSFPVTAPAVVSGAAVDPLFAWLTSVLPDNYGTSSVVGYTKFLIGRDGAGIRRFEPAADAKELIAAIQAALAVPVPPAPPRPVPPAPSVPPVAEAAAPAPEAVIPQVTGPAPVDPARLPVPVPAQPDADIVDAELVDDELSDLQARVDADALAEDLAADEDEPGSLGADLIGLSDELRDIEIDSHLAQEYRSDPTTGS